MPDFLTKKKRSELMATIRSTGNKATELRFIAVFRAHGITGWRRGAMLREKGVGRKGKAAFRVRPDFVFRAQRVAVFVDGCFWHGCPRHATRPRQNRQFWDEKIARNRQRDRLVTRELRKSGWTVLRLWECALARKRQAQTLGRLRRALGK